MKRGTSGIGEGDSFGQRELRTTASVHRDQKLLARIGDLAGFRTHVEAVDSDRSARRGQQRREHLDRRRFSRPDRPEKPEELPFRDGHVYTVDCHCPVGGDEFEPIDIDCGRGFTDCDRFLFVQSVLFGRVGSARRFY